jgi:4-hydroxy-tetrahydrodipicolinate synthase
MLEGIIPSLPTPFDLEGQVDLPSLRSLVNYLIEKGVHGLGTLALASESYKLTETERGLVMRTVISETRGRVPVVVASDHTGTYGAVQRSREAQELGADAVMVLPPYFIRPDADGLYQHYAAISTGISMPIVVQDSPGLTGVSMSAPFLVRLSEELEHIHYVKVEEQSAGPKISALVQSASERLRVLSGWGGLTILDSLQRGASGCMPGADFAPALLRVYQCFKSGDTAAARDLFASLLPLLAFAAQSLDALIIVAKKILVREGVIANALVRQPAGRFDQFHEAELQALLERSKAFLYL